MKHLNVYSNIPVVVVTNSMETWWQPKFFQMALRITMKTHHKLAVVVVQLSPTSLAIYFSNEEFGAIDPDRFVLRSTTATSNLDACRPFPADCRSPRQLHLLRPTFTSLLE